MLQGSALLGTLLQRPVLEKENGSLSLATLRMADVPSHIHPLQDERRAARWLGKRGMNVGPREPMGTPTSVWTIGISNG